MDWEMNDLWRIIRHFTHVLGEKTEEEKRKFAEKRKMHYQEGKVWKDMKSKGKLEDT